MPGCIGFFAEIVLPSMCREASTSSGNKFALRVLFERNTLSSLLSVENLAVKQLSWQLRYLMLRKRKE